MSDEGQYCGRCQRWMGTADPIPPVHFFFYVVTLFTLPALLLLLRCTLLPPRCLVCFAPDRPRRTRVEPCPQPPEEIDVRLSKFDRRVIPYTSRTHDGPSPEQISTFSHERGFYTVRLRDRGRFDVGGAHEKILHVARIQPEFFLYGYIGRFFYLLFFPVTWLNLRHRRSKNPHVHFFPLDRHRAGRIILTDRRLVIYDVGLDYYGHSSIPLENIREVRQHQSSLRIQLTDPPPASPSAAPSLKSSSACAATSHRPALATERLALSPGGGIRYTLKTPYRDGTTHVLF